MMRVGNRKNIGSLSFELFIICHDFTLCCFMPFIMNRTRNLQLVTPIDDDNGGTRDVEMAEPTAVGTGFGGGISSFCSKTFFCGQEANVSEETGIDHVDFDKLFDLTHPHPSIDLKRMEIIKQKLQELDDDEEKKRKIIIMKYATDPYFFDDDR